LHEPAVFLRIVPIRRPVVVLCIQFLAAT
jgi:hypothetical protein